MAFVFVLPVIGKVVIDGAMVAWATIAGVGAVGAIELARRRARGAGGIVIPSGRQGGAGGEQGAEGNQGNGKHAKHGNGAGGAGGASGGSGGPPPNPTGRGLIRAIDYIKRKKLKDLLKELGYVSRGFTGGHEQFYNAEWNHSVYVPTGGELKVGTVSNILDGVYGLDGRGQK